jgi:D-3-phosphoglycerate dehydrogenase
LKVLITEPLSEQGLAQLRQELTVTVECELSREALLGCIGEYDGIIVRSGTVLDREVLERATHLKIIGRAGTGVDNIDLEMATLRGILVVNAPESNTISAAEHTMALLLSQLRNIPKATALLRGGKWDKQKFRGVEAYEKCLGIIGLGRIGSLVARMAQGLGMQVIAYDPYISLERFQRFGAQRMETLDELCRQADFITVHTPKNEETYGMVGEEQFKLMKGGVRVVNCARGGIIDEEALYRALKNGRVASAGLDVFDQEPCEKHKLFELDNVTLTPHLGGATQEALERVGRDIAEEVIRGLRGDLVKYPLNMPFMDLRLQAYIEPYLQLAEKMGRLCTELFRPQIDRVEITYGGEISRYGTELVTTAALKGILTPILDQAVNMVNASAIAAERGIQVKESKIAEIEDYHTSLTLQAGGQEIAGTVFGKGDFRIVKIDGFKLDIVPSGPILISWHTTAHTYQPGVIGQIGTLLGQAGINIHRIEVGNSEEGERAMLVLNLDNSPPSELLSSMRQTPGVLDVKLIQL